MAKSKDPREGGWAWNLFYKYWGGPAATQGAIQGFTQEARDGWKRDLEARKRWSREQQAAKAKLGATRR